MVEVFKTNVQKSFHAKNLVAWLIQHLPNSKINVDLHDCDKVLRVEAQEIAAEKIIMLVKAKGFACKILE